jgi:hypothetical protein
MGASPDKEEMEEVGGDAAQDGGDPLKGMPGHLPNEKEAKEHNE